MNLLKHRLRGWMILAVLTALVVVGATSCGGETVGDDATEGPGEVDEFAINTIGERSEISAWTRPASAFTYDEFVNAGWKQYQIYDVDTLPDALEARYGFYNRRDVEIRRYPSHEAAMSSGVDSAQEALARVVHDGSGFTSRRIYGGFLVVGDLVMMCEVSIDDCIDLLEAVEANSPLQ